VSCARDGAQNTVLFNVVREVEKEVVLVEPIGSASNAPIAMEVDTRLPGVDDGTHGLTPPEASHRILKVIKKLEVQVLCPQHNPVCLTIQYLSQSHFLTGLDCHRLLPRLKKQAKWTELRQNSYHIPV
jgi:hypothetical protein